MPNDDPRRVLTEYKTRVDARNWDGAAHLLAEDYVEDQPQSGKRVLGPANLRHIFDRYPCRQDRQELWLQGHQHRLRRLALWSRPQARPDVLDLPENRVGLARWSALGRATTQLDRATHQERASR